MMTIHPYTLRDGSWCARVNHSSHGRFWVKGSDFRLLMLRVEVAIEEADADRFYQRYRMDYPPQRDTNAINEHCSDCGAEVIGAHGFCQGSSNV